MDPATSKVLKSGQAQGSGTRFTVALSAADTQNLKQGIYYLYLLGSSDAVSQVTERRLDVDMAGGGVITVPGDNGENGGGGGGGGISPMLIVIPIALLVGGGLVFMILKGAKTKK